MPNCPIRVPATIKAMLDSFQKTDVDFMMSHTRYGWMNPWWACRSDDEGRAAPLFPEQMKQRSQDLPDLYCPTGAIWVAKMATLKAHKTFHGPDKRVFEIPWQEAVDIDDQDDWDMAELVFEQMKRKAAQP